MFARRQNVSGPQVASNGLLRRTPFVPRPVYAGANKYRLKVEPPLDFSSTTLNL